MSIILRLISYFIGNILGLILAGYFFPDFIVDYHLENIATVAGLLMAVNIFVRPALKMIFAPLIFVTLGLFTIIINASLLYIIDFISPYITINGLDTLLYGTLILSAGNIISGWSAKIFARQESVPPIENNN